MTSYVAMLRGINVGGHAKVSMVDLRDSFAEMGFDAPRTYIQSGNLLFATSTAPAKLRTMLEEGLEARFGLEIKVVLRTGAQLADVVARNPLASGGRDPSKLHVTFLATKPATSTPSGPRTFLPDEFRLSGREVYVHCPEGYGRTKLNNAFFERSLDVVATTRTWRTVTTLADMAS